MKDLIIGKMFDTNELNRLQRCAKNKDKKEIIKWAQDFEARLSELYHQRYKEYYLEEYKERLKKIDTALLFSLHFGEDTNFDNDKLKSTMDDLAATIKSFYSGEVSQEEYRRMLKDDGINIADDI